MDKRIEGFIDRMGMASEADGLTRIAGRIFGYLLVTPGECSLEDLAVQLNVSRASISNDARRLAQIGLIERRTRPGDRRDYYRSAPNAFRHSLQIRIEGLRRFHSLLNEARALGIDDAEVNARLKAWDEAHRLLLESFTSMLAQVDASAAHA